MWHNFKYAFKTLLKNRSLIFWTYAFPLVLGTFFYMAFNNITEAEKLKVFDIAIVNNEAFNSDIGLKEALKTLGDSKNKDQLFNIVYVDEDEAKSLLNDAKIEGYIINEKNQYEIIITTNGINQTILKYVLEEVMQTSNIMDNITEGASSQSSKMVDYDKLYQEIATIINESTANVKDISNNRLNYMLIEFYTLIAMSALYSGMLGMSVLNQTLANMSAKGKRVSISPASKSKLVFSGLLASYVVQIIGLLTLFLYTTWILKIDYGSNLPLIILLAIIGTLSGLSLGMCVGAAFKTSENMKVGIIMAFTLLGCFFAGMQGVQMKYIIDTHAPIVNKLNPASIITDGFYALYYYDTNGRYWLNIVSLLIFTVLMMSIALIALRRQKYDSI